MEDPNSIYHERQSLELCLKHALNNLFQATVFNRQQLDEICYSLTPDTNFLTNPHKSMLGVGNYDVNVLVKALHTKDCTAVWFDRRKDPHCLDLDNIVGFVVNMKSQVQLGPLSVPLWKRNHWISVKEIGGAFYNLDSKLTEPELIGNCEDALTFIKQHLNSPDDNQVFVVVALTVANEQTYLHPPYREENVGSS